MDCVECNVRRNVWESTSVGIEKSFLTVKKKTSATRLDFCWSLIARSKLPSNFTCTKPRSLYQAWDCYTSFTTFSLTFIDSIGWLLLVLVLLFLLIKFIFINCIKTIFRTNKKKTQLETYFSSLPALYFMDNVILNCCWW